MGVNLNRKTNADIHINTEIDMNEHLSMNMHLSIQENCKTYVYMIHVDN